MLLWKDVQWKGGNNFYALKSLRFDKTSFTPQTFGDFQKLTGQDAGSQWPSPAAATATPVGVGVDLAVLEAAVPAEERASFQKR